MSGASRAGADVLAELPEAALAVQYVWVPVLPDDSERMASVREKAWAEPRARHYWDPELRFAKHMAEALAITDTESQGLWQGPAIAWDVYLLYGPGEKRMERPDFWMHQLAIERAPRLDEGVWLERVREVTAGADHG